MPAVIDAVQLQTLILRLIPEFEVDEERKAKGRPPTEAWLFTRLLDAVDPWVRAGDEARLRPIFGLVEQCQIEGTPGVANEACTCFLESLSNRLGWQQPELKPWVRTQLGAHSRAFWDAWEEA